MVFGVSADSVKSHEKFRRKQELPYHLLADPDHAVCEAYGVWGEKKFMGKSYMGISRTTFLIDAQGKIARVFEGVKPDGHAEEVAEALQALRQG
jgi:thioredoxin-dependent peroxiredoxin